MDTRAVLFLFIALILFVIYDIAERMPTHPYVHDIWVINLDKDAERWDNVYARTERIRDIVHRWPATYGKTQDRDVLHKEGVGFAMTQGGDRKSKEISNGGVIGCWISHTRLLKHLATLDVPDWHGHLICEDDIEFPLDFLKPGDYWHQVHTQVPTDWDIVYLGITQPVGTQVKPNVLKLHNGHGNWGTYCYMVRHGALRSKILPDMRWMVDAIDEQYKEYFHTWNVYGINPNVIPLNDELNAKSTIQSYK